ncbi:MAG: S-methyl thiohydantoin desulfurase domain-containing protein [Chloroflexota bacterium]
MARLRLTKELVEAAVLGGSVLGGGGGGSADDGRRNGLLAVDFGAPELVDVDDLPDDAMLATASAVGSPAAKTAYVLPMHYVRAVEMLMTEGDVDLQGLVSSEVGGIAVTNGWMQAAALGIAVVDAPCNGRAHPISIQGAIGLHRVEGYVSLQAAIGGDPAQGRYLEMFVRGKLQTISPLMPLVSAQAGGMVAVARNPVTVAYTCDHAAVGAVKQAIKVGQAMLERRGGEPLELVEAACDVLGGEVVGRGRVLDVKLETRSGLDVGLVRVQTGQSEAFELSFWNEYMTLEAVSPAGAHRRVATFPDLMATFDLSTGTALSSAMIQAGQEVAIVTVPRQKLILGAGVKDPELLKPVEETVGKEVLKYVS